MVKYLLVGLLILGSLSLKGQSTEKPYENPKLVIGIVVDQMRYDYLTRFWDRYGDGGFKRMVNEGFNCKNNHFNYVPTSTGPGHASVHTGTTPSVHGIIGNSFYSRIDKKMVYCAGDSNYQSVGSAGMEGQMAPSRMKTTTIADQNRIHTQFRGKTIGIALKDRGSVLPAGHTANAAYWFYGKDKGDWITSTFYMSELPKWVQRFNKKKSVDQYLTTWNTLYDIKTYRESGPDENEFEGKHVGKVTFPYDFKMKKGEKNYDVLRPSAFGNSLTTDFALAAIEEENLGVDDDTDFLALSFSSTDYVGHQFGVNSVEVQDTYLRLDKDLERLFNYLDKKVGKNNYTVFLTADHGAIHVPNYLKSIKVPAGSAAGSEQKKTLTEFVERKFEAIGLVESVSNDQVFLDYQVAKKFKLDLKEVRNALAEEIITYDKVANVFTKDELLQNNIAPGIAELYRNGYNQKLSGDVMILYDPGYISYERLGSTHGTAHIYDTHVPLLFLGKGINQGSTTEKTNITDIAPTISALLGIAFPNGATGQPISKAID